MTYSVIVERCLQRARGQDESLDKLKQATNGLPKWRVSKTMILKDREYNTDTQLHEFQYQLYFMKDGGRQDESTLSNEWSRIVGKLQKLCELPSWKDYKWTLKSVSPKVSIAPIIIDDVAKQEGAQFGCLDGDPKTIQEISHNLVPLVERMLHDEDELRRRFHGIFDREPQIRCVLSAVHSFLTTQGKRRNHVLLWGLPACAKTQILRTLGEILGEGSTIRLDATSTTQAGIYKLFFDELEDKIPPFVFIEEIEKCHEDGLRVWLGALDDRGELRKTNFRESRARKIQILTLATANDKVVFDRLMGGTEKRAGALSSRFVNQLHCPRPDEKVLRKILERDIDSYGGHTDWIDHAINLAKVIDTDDPRRVLSYLDGGDRLLTGHYQKDVLTMHFNQIAEDDHCSAEKKIMLKKTLENWDDLFKLTYEGV